MSDDRVIVFHGNCHDGTTALWAAKQHPDWTEAETCKGLYPESPPDLERLGGKRVLIVDYSWKRPAMLTLAAAAESVLVIDHHSTAQKELVDISLEAPNVRVHFDMERSGAGLTWDVLHVGATRPPLIDYVEDRDLWRFRLPFTREIHAACDSYALTLEERDRLMRVPGAHLAEEGRHILRYHAKLVESALDNAHIENHLGHLVPVIDCPIIEVISDIGHGLLQQFPDSPFAMVRTLKPDGTVICSLRSRKGGFDVGALARQCGGGGHKSSAGFAIKHVSGFAL